MSNDTDHRSKFKSSAEVLQSLFSKKEGPMGDQFLRWKLWMQWADIVGPTTSSVCEPVAFHHGVLWLWVKNSAWMTQLHFLTGTIKNTINQKFAHNMVQEIRLTKDRKQVPVQNDQDFKKMVRTFLGK